ncbi:MAG: PAS domain-containing protein, partial [Acidimicrobiia bacterium]|nr:PAS domain-containing protein [Acidimicrobiia bacterium]
MTVDDLGDDRAAAERLRQLFETIGDVVSYRYRVMPTPGYEYISANCESLVGYSAEEFYDDPELWLKLVHPDDQEALQLMFVPGASPITVRWRTRDGDLRWALQSASTRVDAHGNVVAFEGLVYDITERVRLVEERRQRGLELHDQVVQGLAVARLAFDVDDRERLDQALTQSLNAARRLVEELLGPGVIDAGDLRQ